MRLFLRSLVFAIAMGASTLVFVPLTILTFPLPFLWRYHLTKHWALFNLWVLKTVCGLRYRLEGAQHIPDENGIIFCKHQSAWETLALQRIFPPQVWVLKRELLWVPLFGWALALMEPIAIDRKAARRALRRIVEQGKERLSRGRWVVIFPEGTRVAPGAQKRYAMGGALLAQRSGYPVVPVAHNAGEFWPRRGFIKRPGTIRVVIGPPIETKGKSAAEINELARVWIEAAMDRISTVGGERPAQNVIVQTPPPPFHRKS